MTLFFGFHLQRRYAPIWWTLGVREDDGVTLTDDTFTATYGRFRVQTPRDNIVDVQRSGPYSAIKAIGLRLSAADSGLTMGTSTAGGVCVLFERKVPRVIGFKDHRGLTVTVADPDGLHAALRSHGSA